MRSKTLISYQKGYCGQYADIEAMKPREARAYCLGVGHVAAGTLPLELSSEVLAALSVRRRRDAGAVITVPSPQDTVTSVWLRGDTVKRRSASGALTAGAIANFPLDEEFTVTQVDPFDNTFIVRSKWVNAEDFVLVRRAVTEPPR